MLWPWSRVSVWPLSVSSKLTERSVATGDQRKQWPRVITRRSWIILASILAEIWPKRVSNLMFYAQSTITVISGWWPKLRKRNKKHIHIKKNLQSRSQRHSYQIKRLLLLISVPHCAIYQKRTPSLSAFWAKMNQLTDVVFTRKAQYWLPFHIQCLRKCQHLNQLTWHWLLLTFLSH